MFSRRDIIEQFLSKQNIRYLTSWAAQNGVFINDSKLKSFSKHYGLEQYIAPEDFWYTVKKMNNAYKNEILSVPEPFHINMFISDSLRPPGLEFMNNKLETDSSGNTKIISSKGVKTPRDSHDMDMMTYSEYYEVPPSLQRYPKCDHFPISQQAEHGYYEHDTENTMGIEYGNKIRGFNMDALRKQSRYYNCDYNY